MRPVDQRDSGGNDTYRVREHQTEAEMEKLLAALKRNRHGHRDWLIGLIVYRHGLHRSRPAIAKYPADGMRSLSGRR
jgi:hypothetical protein